MIERQANEIPSKLLYCSGSVFYSGRNAFRSTFPLCMLGVNPGGSPDLQVGETIRTHTRKVLDVEKDDWSSNRDECWRNSNPGASGMQPRVLHLLAQPKFSPGDVPASNVVFARSRREADIKGVYATLAEECWPFHLAAIKQPRPRVVLCFGQTPGNYVRQKLGAEPQIDEFVEDNNRRWRSRTYLGIDGSRAVAGNTTVA
jgi:hypothetical protein